MLPMRREKSVHKTVCQMVCLIMAQFVYLMSGSAVFMLLEQQSAQEGYMATLDKLKLLRKTLNLTRHQERVLQDAFGKGFAFHDTELPEKAKHAWDFISTLYFSITSTTTIGYGHHSPNTAYGQLFCILFSLFGIPLHMVTLGTIGRHLNTVISRSLNWVGGKFIRRGQGRKGQRRKEVGTFAITTCLLVFFTLFSAGSVRLMMPDVSYTEAIYFIYVTISTIGFGDFVIRFEEGTEYSRILILIFWAVAVYVGMSILSATIMSLSVRTKQLYTTIFNGWDTKVLGKTFRKASRVTGRERDRENLIVVRKEFLIEQLDKQTDPSKREEIQRWIDMCNESSESSLESFDLQDEFEYTDEPPN